MANASLRRSIWLLKAEQYGGDPSEDSYVKTLTQHHFSAELFPVLSFTFTNQSCLREMLLTPDSYAGIVFTSPRSVEAVFQASEVLPLKDSWREKRSYCVGAKTFETAENLLGITCAGAECGNAQNLAGLIRKETEAGSLPYLFPCSSIRRDVLPTILAESQLQLVEIQAYDTIPHPELESLITESQSKNKWPEFLIFFSPSGVQYAKPILDKLNCPWSDIKVISLGPSTTAALHKANLKVSAECAKPCPEALLGSL